MAAVSTLTRGSTSHRAGDRGHAQEALTRERLAMERRRAGKEFSSGWLFHSVVGLSTGEIAALGISARTVNALLFPARERFRAVFGRLDPARPQPAQGGSGGAG